jgi:hypoxanthine phosphoribosyltransferase
VASNRQLSWGEYDDFLRSIIQQLRADNVEFEHIIGISRGGLPLTASLAAVFGIREVGVLFMQKTIADRAFSDRLPEAKCLGIGIPFALHGKRVLLLDDILRTGHSAKRAGEILAAFGATVVRTAALFAQSDSYPFSYHAPSRVDAKTWIIFPWSAEALGVQIAAKGTD